VFCIFYPAPAINLVQILLLLLILCDTWGGIFFSLVSCVCRVTILWSGKEDTP
jgi:hypothetical protein